MFSEVDTPVLQLVQPGFLGERDLYRFPFLQKLHENTKLLCRDIHQTPRQMRAHLLVCFVLDSQYLMPEESNDFCVFLEPMTTLLRGRSVTPKPTNRVERWHTRLYIYFLLPRSSFVFPVAKVIWNYLKFEKEKIKQKQFFFQIMAVKGVNLLGISNLMLNGKQNLSLSNTRKNLAYI